MGYENKAGTVNRYFFIVRHPLSGEVYIIPVPLLMISNHMIAFLADTNQLLFYEGAGGLIFIINFCMIFEK
jgi:hypothetical protein